MKRVNNILMMMVVVSTVAFAGLFDKMFGPTKEQVAEFRYSYAKQLIDEDVSTYRGKVLTFNQVMQNITDGVILDDILQYGTTWSPTTDIPLTIEEIPNWLKKEEIEVPVSLFKLMDTYSVKSFYNTSDTMRALQAYPINVVPYSDDLQTSIKEAMIAGIMNAKQLVKSRKDDLVLTLDKKSQEYADIIKLQNIDSYIVTYVENKETKSGKIVFDNNIIVVSIPYTFDEEGNYSANMDLSDAIVEVSKRHGLTNEFISSERFSVPDMFDSAMLAKEKLLKLGTTQLTVNDSVEKECLSVTNFYFLREAYSEVIELIKAK